ncbi:MAG: sulfite exporter TauE/SafE family protein [Clostridia bacterium]|nr:sulfite exporter TauE/SafE family protein [Clostridia bacterium]
MLYLCLLIGFVGQLIDGTLGMAYGVSCNTFLQTIYGASPLIASSIVHFSEIFASGISAFAHFKFKNVDKSLFIKLVIPGVIGGAAGALLLSEYGDHLKGAVSVYLIIMGVLILIKAFRNKKTKGKTNRGMICGLAAAGGALDAAGGGGWGPVVTSTLLFKTKEPSKAIGTANAAEFFVTLAESAVFAASVSGIGEYWKELVMMVIGGAAAAPIAAVLCKKINQKILLIIVGLLVIGLNVYNLINYIS